MNIKNQKIGMWLNMRVQLIIFIWLYSNALFAAPPVTYQFANGTTIEASQVNANYQELADRIEVSDNTATVNGLSTDVSVLQGQVLQLQNELAGLTVQNKKQLAGFTAATIPLNSRENTLDNIALCQSEFLGSALCTVNDIYNTTVLPILPSNSGGIVFEINSSGWARTVYCANSKGLVSSDTTSGSSPCAINTKLACCK